MDEKVGKVTPCLNWYPRAESNRNRQNRNLKFYPLNYGGAEYSANITHVMLKCKMRRYSSCGNSVDIHIGSRS